MTLVNHRVVNSTNRSKSVWADSQEDQLEDINILVSEYQNSDTDAKKNRILDRILKKHSTQFFFRAHRITNLIPLEDRMSICRIALLKAAEKYDPKKGASFKTYFEWWVKGLSQEELNKAFTIHVPHNRHLELAQYKKGGVVHHLITAKMKELAEDGIELTYDQVKRILDGNYLPDDLKEIVEVNHLTSLETPVSTGKNSSEMQLHEVIEQSCFPSPDLKLTSDGEYDDIVTAIRCLEGDEREVIERMYGFYKDPKKPEESLPPMGLREVGYVLRCSHEKVRKIRDKGLARLERLIRMARNG